MQLKEFFLSKIFLKNLGYAVLATLVLVWITTIILSFYTNKGENFPTPDFKGLTIAQVEALASDQDFRFVIEDSVYRKEFIPGTVVFQNPAAHHKIKPNRLIYITLAAYNPEMAEAPKLTDVSIRQAKELLESKGFALGAIRVRPSEFDDLVLEQLYKGKTLEPGTGLPNGSTIDLVVGKHMTGGETTVPDLKMVTFTTAQNILKSRALNVGATIYDPEITTLEDSMNAIVWKQEPASDPNMLVMPGTSVDMWLKLKSQLSDPSPANP